MKMMSKITMLAVVIILFALGCQKTSLLDESRNAISDKGFNAAYAKSWFYNSFENSGEGKRSNINEKKFPIWTKGKYHKIGNLEVIEFPLLVNKKQIPVPSIASLIEKRWIASAALTRIKFTKNATGAIFVTQVIYIPDLQYLQKKNFDISNISYGTSYDDFTGRMIVKKWNDIVLSINEVTNGKITGKKKINNNNTSAVKLINEPEQSFIEVDCGPGGQEWCTVEQSCDVYADGLWANCSDFELVPGSCYCESGGGGEEPDLCELYGIGCGDGGGGGEEPPPPTACAGCGFSTIAEAEAQLDAITSSCNNIVGTPTIGAASTPNANGVITKPWANHGCGYSHTRLGFWTCHFSAKYLGTLFKETANDPWKFQEFHFNHVTMDAGQLPPCYGVEITSNVQGGIIDNGLRAQGTGSFTVTFKITCPLLGATGSDRAITETLGGLEWFNAQ